MIGRMDVNDKLGAIRLEEVVANHLGQLVRTLELGAVLDCQADEELHDDAREEVWNVVEIMLIISHENISLHDLIQPKRFIINLNVIARMKEDLLTNAVASHDQLR